jgi:hypothetical protein
MSNNIWGGIDYNNTKRIINLKSQVDSMQVEQQNLIEMMPSKADILYVDEKHTEMQDLLAESEIATDARLDGVDATLLLKADTSTVTTQLAAKADTSTVTPKADKTYVDTQDALKVDKAGGNFTSSIKINPTNTSSDKIIYSNGSGGTYSGHKIVQTASSLDEYIPNGSRNQWYYTSADGLTRTLAFSISGDTGNIAFTNALNLPTVTASRVLVTDGLKYIINSAVTATELTALSGITGVVQTRLNALESGAGTVKSFRIAWNGSTFSVQTNVGINAPTVSTPYINVPWTTAFGGANAVFTMSYTINAPATAPYRLEGSCNGTQATITVRDNTGNLVNPNVITDMVICGRATL